ncbi:MAG: aldo/keto reductase [Halobacteriaceae archaeon]
MSVAVPRPGLGTSGNTEETTCIESVRSALETGYRHLDTAQMYDNEEYFGAGIEQSSVDREDIFLATKVHPDNLGAGDIRPSVEASLDRLGTTYVDLLYVHWPIGAYDAATTLPVFDELRDDGYIDHVGVSNFTPELLEEAASILDAPITAHQVERHPLLPQSDLLEAARTGDHTLVAYAPLLQGRLDMVPVLADIAADHDATPAQVCLAWHLASDHVAPIPKGTGDHITENWAARDLSLTEEDLAAIDAVSERQRLVDPDRAPWNR